MALRPDYRRRNRPVDDLPIEPGRTADDYEFRIVTLDRATSRADARRLLTDEAEYGKWHLARTRLYQGGTRKVWLRRRIMRLPELVD